MKYVNLGKTGLKVSRLSLDTMTSCSDNHLTNIVGGLLLMVDGETTPVAWAWENASCSLAQLSRLYKSYGITQNYFYILNQQRRFSR